MKKIDTINKDLYKMKTMMKKLLNENDTIFNNDDENYIDGVKIDREVE